MGGGGPDKLPGLADELTRVLESMEHPDRAELCQPRAYIRREPAHGLDPSVHLAGCPMVGTEHGREHGDEWVDQMIRGPGAHERAHLEILGELALPEVLERDLEVGLHSCVPAGESLWRTLASPLPGGVLDLITEITQLCRTRRVRAQLDDVGQGGGESWDVEQTRELLGVLEGWAQAAIEPTLLRERAALEREMIAVLGRMSPRELGTRLSDAEVLGSILVRAGGRVASRESAWEQPDTVAVIGRELAGQINDLRPAPSVLVARLMSTASCALPWGTWAVVGPEEMLLALGENLNEHVPVGAPGELGARLRLSAELLGSGSALGDAWRVASAAILD